MFAAKLRMSKLMAKTSLARVTAREQKRGWQEGPHSCVATAFKIRGCGVGLCLNQMGAKASLCLACA